MYKWPTFYKAGTRNVAMLYQQNTQICDSKANEGSAPMSLSHF